MALTPDDVVTKQFQHVRFKEGFDPDEVDDFLDEIVVEWRKSIAENDELKAKLAAYESGEAPAPAPQPQRPSPSRRGSRRRSAAVRRRSAHGHGRHHRARAAPPRRARRRGPGAARQAHRRRQVAGSHDRVRRRDPWSRRDSPSLDRERGGLETRISELRQFERDYRAQLRSYMEGKLRDLETMSTTSGSTPVSAIGL